MGRCQCGGHHTGLAIDIMPGHDDGVREEYTGRRFRVDQQKRVPVRLLVRCREALHRHLPRAMAFPVCGHPHAYVMPKGVTMRSTSIFCGSTFGERHLLVAWGSPLEIYYARKPGAVPKDRD